VLSLSSEIDIPVSKYWEKRGKNVRTPMAFAADFSSGNNINVASRKNIAVIVILFLLK
jgi:hypothetical protein